MARIKIKLEVQNIDMGDWKSLPENARARLADFLEEAFGTGAVLTLELETNFQRVKVLAAINKEMH
jgi:hypothetical protein